MKLSDIVKEKEDDEKVVESTSRVIDGNSEAVETNKEVTEGNLKVTETSKEEVEKLNKELFEKIKNIALSQNRVESKVIYFSKKGKATIVMNKFELKPSANCLLNRKNFKEVYLKELEDVLFNERVDENKLMGIMYLFSRINKGFYPLGIKFNGFNSLEKDIIFVLNKFFNKNKHLMNGMFNMMNNSIKEEKEESEDSLKKLENNE